MLLSKLGSYLALQTEWSNEQEFLVHTSETLMAGSIGREERLIDLLKVLPLSGWQISLGKFQANAFIMIISMAGLQIIAAIILQWTIWSTILGVLGLLIFNFINKFIKVLINIKK